MSMISELVEELIDNADLHTKELHDLMYRAAETIEMLSEKAREPKQGEWNPYYTERKHNDIFNCKLCGDTFVVMQGKDDMNFCPNCGAMMKGADDE